MTGNSGPHQDNRYLCCETKRRRRSRETVRKKWGEGWMPTVPVMHCATAELPRSGSQRCLGPDDGIRREKGPPLNSRTAETGLPFRSNSRARLKLACGDRAAAVEGESKRGMRCWPGWLCVGAVLGLHDQPIIGGESPVEPTPTPMAKVQTPPQQPPTAAPRSRTSGAVISASATPPPSANFGICKLHNNYA